MSSHSKDRRSNSISCLLQKGVNNLSCVDALSCNYTGGNWWHLINGPPVTELAAGRENLKFHNTVVIVQKYYVFKVKM